MTALQEVEQKIAELQASKLELRLLKTKIHRMEEDLQETFTLVKEVLGK